MSDVNDFDMMYDTSADSPKAEKPKFRICSEGEHSFMVDYIKITRNEGKPPFLSVKFKCVDKDDKSYGTIVYQGVSLVSPSAKDSKSENAVKYTRWFLKSLHSSANPAAKMKYAISEGIKTVVNEDGIDWSDVETLKVNFGSCLIRCKIVHRKQRSRNEKYNNQIQAQVDDLGPVSSDDKTKIIEQHSEETIDINGTPFSGPISQIMKDLANSAEGDNEDFSDEFED